MRDDRRFTLRRFANYLYLKRFLFVPVLAAGLALLGWFSPLLFGEKALFWGTPALQFVPWWTFAFQTVLDGHLPLWNPGVGMGAPLMANYQTALFYPPTWILLACYALGGVPWLAWGLTPVLGMHLLVTALGMACLMRRLGQGVFAQTISALVWAMCSYLTARVNFPPILFCATWLPWILLILTPEAGQAFFNKSKFLRLTACLAFLLLGGHAQTAWYSLIIAAAWSAFWAWHGGMSPRPDGYKKAQDPVNRVNRVTRWKSLLKTWVWFGAALLLAAGIASVQLIPTAEYFLQSQRAEAVDFDLAMTYSLWPWRLASLLAPGLFGSPVQGDYWGYANYWEDAIYIGLLPLLLALSFLFRPARIRKFDAGDEALADSSPTGSLNLSFKAWVLIGLGLTVIWALGRFTPVYPWLYRSIPTFDLFQAPARVLIWFEFLLALLAGLGAATWRRPTGRGLYWSRLATAGAVAVSLGAGFAWALLGEISPSMLRATALAGVWGVLAGILSLTAPYRQATDGYHRRENQGKFSGWQIAVLAVVMADLLSAAWGLNPGIPLNFYQVGETSTLVSRLSASSRAYIPASLEERLKFDNFFSFETFTAEEPWEKMRELRLPNLGLLEGKPMVNNFDPFVPGRFQKWIDYLSELRIDELERLLAWMDVDQLMVTGDQALYRVEWRSLDGASRLHWLTCVEYVLDDESAWQGVTRVGFDWEEWVILEDASRAGQLGCTSPVAMPPNNLKKLDTNNPNQWRAEVRADTEGWLVLADTWYPGWQVRLDGDQGELLRANYLFQAVHVPAGQHTVDLIYQPFSFWLGSVCSLASLSLLGLIGLWRRRRKG